MFVLCLLWVYLSLIYNWMVVVFNYNWMLIFIVMILMMKMYDGVFKDVNGIKFFKFNIGGMVYEVDINVFGVMILFILNIIVVIFLLNV